MKESLNKEALDGGKLWTLEIQAKNHLQEVLSQLLLKEDELEWPPAYYVKTHDPYKEDMKKTFKISRLNVDYLNRVRSSEHRTSTLC